MVVKDVEEVRKGPWTEEEDVRLAFNVNIFGDRRWDFIAKVSGLKVVGDNINRFEEDWQELQAQMGELFASWLEKRWSKIAGKLPGRTDNEIKNFWRTHLRKNNSQEKNKKTIIPPSSLSSTSISSVSSTSSNFNSHHVHSTQGHKFHISDDNISRNNSSSFGYYWKDKESGSRQVCSMDDIWNDIPLPEIDSVIVPPPVCGGFSQDATMVPSIWDDNYYCPNNSLLWAVDGGLV